MRWRAVLAECRDLLRAHLALARASYFLRMRTRGNLVAPEAPNSFAGISVTPDSRARKASAERLHVETEEGDVVRRLTRLVGRAAARSPLHPGCLPRALALQALLEDRGIEGTAVRVGVRYRDGDLMAHAWLERGGVPLGEPEEALNEFAPLERLSVLRTDG